MKIPFTGLFVGGNAVIFITLIAYFSNSRKTIFEVTLKVILVKFVVSPYTPLNAYFAVFVQSLLGFILYYNGFNRFSPVILGFLSLLLSAFQKVFVLTIVFGMTLWESIDIFIQFVLKQILPNSIQVTDINVSFSLISVYVLIHLIGGVLAGIYASDFPIKFSKVKNVKKISLNNSFQDLLNNSPKIKNKKKIWTKTSSYVLITFSILLIIISFLFEEVDNNVAIDIIFMLVRSLLIIFIWYYFISPILLKLLKKYLSDKKQNRAEEIEKIINLFPGVKYVIKYSWSEAQHVSKIKRIFVFFDNILIHYLLLEDVNGKEN